MKEWLPPVRFISFTRQPRRRCLLSSVHPPLARSQVPFPLEALQEPALRTYATGFHCDRIRGRARNSNGVRPPRCKSPRATEIDGRQQPPGRARIGQSPRKDGYA
jgi:hypothetical protein